MKFEEEFLNGQFFEFLILFMCLDGNQALSSFIKALPSSLSKLQSQLLHLLAELSSKPTSK